MDYIKKWEFLNLITDTYEEYIKKALKCGKNKKYREFN